MRRPLWVRNIFPLSYVVLATALLGSFRHQLENVVFACFD
jgi:hypothetical protein